jgi:hypothetical protein
MLKTRVTSAAIVGLARICKRFGPATTHAVIGGQVHIPS